MRPLDRSLTNYIEASGISLTLADARLPDLPLLAVNDAFLDMTGYDVGDVMGRNCRFLQPSEGIGPVRERMRRFLREHGATQGRFIVPNCRADGEPFLNLVYMTKLRATHDGEGGELVLGSQFDVTSLNVDRLSAYDAALSSDLVNLREVSSRYNWHLLATYDSLASSAALVAQHFLDRNE